MNLLRDRGEWFEHRSSKSCSHDARFRRNGLTFSGSLGTWVPPRRDQRLRSSRFLLARSLPRALMLSLAFLLSVAVMACGGGPSQEEVQRSMNEFRLAATYRDEGDVPGRTSTFASCTRSRPRERAGVHPARLRSA